MIVTPKPDFRELDRDRVHQITVGRTYVVLGIDYDVYRIIDDNGGPFEYPIRLFDTVENTIPPGWTIDIDVEVEDNEVALYLGPAELNVTGFYEDFFDCKPDAIEVFRRHCVSIGVEWDAEEFIRTGGRPPDIPIPGNRK